MRIFFFFLFMSLLSCNQAPKTQEVDSVKPVENNPLVFPDLPKEITFAGQKVDLSDIDVRERLDREVLLMAYYQSATTGGFKRAHRFFPRIEKILKAKGIPDDFKYLAVIESNLLQAVSPVGAQGIWQFMPVTAKQHNLEISAEVDERLHFEKSTFAACDYLTDAYVVLDDWLLTAAAYNRGVGGVQQDMSWQNSEHYFDTEQNSETGRYVFRILAAKIIMENPEAYGYFPKQIELYNPIKTKKIKVTESITNLVEWAEANNTNLRIVRKLNPWLLTLHLKVKNKAYYIEIPTESENLKPYSQR
ncbi:MAG: lytic transglycosylase domain-containing protein [Fluviicola sp.]